VLVTVGAPTNPIELLRATLLFSWLSEQDLADLVASCGVRDVAAGELLITEGEPGDDLFVIVSGEFEVSQKQEGADALVLGTVTHGEFVGEAALLERVRRTASVRALVAGQALVFSHAILEHFLEQHPDSRNLLLETLRCRAAWSAARRYRPEPAVVMRMLADQISGLEAAALHELAGEVQWVTVPRHTLVLKQGTPGDCLYFLIEGRLRAFVSRDDGSEARIGEIGPGESVGEMALLSPEPRSANTAAMTDCQLLRLSKRGFDELVTRHPRTLATFTRTIVTRLAQRIRSRGLITQLRTSPLVTTEDCAEVARTENLVLRNLKITQMYHRLSLEMTTLVGHQDANWCTFACNASKTAGYSIRKEELLPFYRVFARLSRYRPVRRAWASFLRFAERIGLDAEAARIPQAVSDSISAGNLKVFDEIAPVFARAIRTFHQDVEYDGEKLASFLAATLRPGPTEAGGQEYLREAFTHYYDAIFEVNPKRKSEIILLANLKVGLHEQIRLQPNIVDALNAPLTVGLRGEFRRRVAHAFSKFLPAGIAMRSARGFDAVERVAVGRLMIALRRLVTARVMQIRLPYGNVRLGTDLPLLPGERLFPDMLQTIEHPELIRFLKRFELDPDSMRGSRAGDWGNLDDRMRFILTLFRTRQKSLELFAEPFLFEQRLAMSADAVPEGQL
jgi:CRP-like cAMP-binding protein